MAQAHSRLMIFRACRGFKPKFCIKSSCDISQSHCPSIPFSSKIGANCPKDSCCKKADTWATVQDSACATLTSPPLAARLGISSTCIAAGHIASFCRRMEAAQQHAHPGTTALQHHVHIPLLEKPFALQGCQVLPECGDEHRVIFAVAQMATEMVLGPSNDKRRTFKPKELDAVGNGILIEGYHGRPLLLKWLFFFEGRRVHRLCPTLSWGAGGREQLHKTKCVWMVVFLKNRVLPLVFYQKTNLTPKIFQKNTEFFHLLLHPACTPNLLNKNLIGSLVFPASPGLKKPPPWALDQTPAAPTVDLDQNKRLGKLPSLKPNSRGWSSTQ